MISITSNSNELNSREINWWEVGLRLMRLSLLEEYLWDFGDLIQIAGESQCISDDKLDGFLDQASNEEWKSFIEAGYDALQAIGMAVLAGALPRALREDECDCPSDCEGNDS